MELYPPQAGAFSPLPGMPAGMPAAGIPPAGTSALAPLGAPAMAAAPELPPGQTLPGQVKAWMEEKGFGFITPDNGGPDVFVHRNQLSDGQTLVTGAAVMFECRLNVARGKYEATTCSGAAGSPSGAPAIPEPFAKGGFGCKGGKGSQDNLFIAGLPLDTTEDSIRDIFGQYGIVQQCKVLPDTPGKTDRAALVRFGDELQARWMVENLNGKALNGMVAPLTVRFAGDRPEKGGCYGKAGCGKGDPAALMDGRAAQRFSPYGAGAAVAQAQAVAAAAANPQLSDASLAAALVQLLPGLNQGQPQMVAPQTLGGLPGQPQAALAGQQPLAAQPLLGQVMPGAELPGQAASNPSIAGAANPLIGNPAAGLQGVAGQLGTAPTSAPEVAAGAIDPSAVPGLDPALGGAATGSLEQAGLPQAAPQWLEASDPASGRPYYYHAVTREVRWDRPAEMG